MVYGYCTDQTDGTSFIGGVFDASATSYPYNAGLAIGGTSGNLLWKGSKVLSANDLGFTTSATNRNYAVKADTNGDLYVNVPWENSVYTLTKAKVEAVLTGAITTHTHNYAASSHNHAASEITSGTLAAARLPAATTSAFGAVKVGSNITVSSGTISLTKSNVTSALGYTPPTSNTTYTAGTGLSLSGTTFNVNLGYKTSGKYYAVNADTNDNLYVYVPWTDTNTHAVSSVNGKTGAVSLTYEDVAAAPTSHTHTWSNISDRASCTINTSGTITGSKVYGAVWNDYAEYRWVLKDKATDKMPEPGRCVVENGNDSMSISNGRLQPGAKIISDTYGMCMGETEKAKTPIAVCGRVLAHPFERKIAFNVGDAVCSGPNGTVSRMTREEIMMYPERIVGTVVSKPTYKEWGPNKIPVNGRIWIQVK